MRLATPASVLNVLGIQTGAGALSTAGGALDAIFPNIESMVESGLIRATRTDFFDIIPSDTEYPTLRLTSGLVTKDEAVTVTAYDAVVDVTGYQIDYDKGTIALLGTLTPGRRVISVTYSHGFDPDPSDTSMLSGIPDALSQGGMLTAAAFLMLNPANIAKEKARFMAAVTVSGLQLEARNALVRYARPRGTVVWPSFTEVAE